MKIYYEADYYIDVSEDNCGVLNSIVLFCKENLIRLSIVDVVNENLVLRFDCSKEKLDDMMFHCGAYLEFCRVHSVKTM